MFDHDEVLLDGAVSRFYYPRNRRSTARDTTTSSSRYRDSASRVQPPRMVVTSPCDTDTPGVTGVWVMPARSGSRVRWPDIVTYFLRPTSFAYFRSPGSCDTNHITIARLRI